MERATGLTLAMMMLATILLVWSRASTAALVVAEDALELDPASLSLPRAVPGTLTVRPCAGCQPRLLRATADTRFAIGTRGPAADFSEFLAAVRGPAAMGRGMFVVLVAPGSDIVTRVLYLGEPGP